jgi:3-oxoacyl-[acyl-carrier-protein] synthase-3
MYGDIYFLNGKIYEFSSIESFHDVYYDINTKEISSGVKVDIYPTSTEYKKGDTVFVSSSGSRSLIKGKIENQEIHKGDVILFASVGAGMNINAIVYKM